MNRIIANNRNFLTHICFDLCLETDGQMLLQFNLSKSQVNASQVEVLSFDRSNRTALDEGNFNCTCNSMQQFDRIVQLRTCPLPESNLTCVSNTSHVNSTVIAGNNINSLLPQWPGGMLGIQSVQVHDLPASTAIYLAYRINSWHGNKYFHYVFTVPFHWIRVIHSACVYRELKNRHSKWSLNKPSSR